MMKMAKNYMSKVITLAKSQIGYYGKKTNRDLDDFTANKSGKFTKYAKDFDTKYPNFYNGRKNGFDWCDVFVDWLFVTAFGEEEGRQMIVQPKKSCGAGCGYSAGYYKSAKRFFSVPKIGDQIFFGRETSYTHTGIVIDVDDVYVYTIEGNIGSPCHVGEKKYLLTDQKIKGYGRPDYDEEPVEDMMLIPVKSGAVLTKKTTASLALRSEPSTTEGYRFFYIPKNSKISIISENVKKNDGYTWDCVFYDQKIGYCANKYLK